MIISQNKKKIGQIIVAVLLVLLLGILIIRGRRTEVSSYTRTGFYFDTAVELTIYDDGTISAQRAEALLDESMSLCAHYESLFSRTKEGTDIWRINHADGAPVAVDPETAALIETALSFAKESGGAVDPTIGALSGLWFPAGNSSETEPNTGRRVPSDEAIREALSHVDYRKVSVSGNTVTLSDPDTILDLGFIAKGYIADMLKEMLKKEGVASALINLGGNVLTIGEKPDGTPFHIGLRDPSNPNGAPLNAVEISDTGVVSSGNYERFFIEDGIRYHHILSTKDGFPVQSGLSQISILSQSSAEGDALSTLCFILGYEDGSAFLKENYPDVTAVFVDEAGNILP